MLVEGKGMVAPACVSVALSPGEAAYLEALANERDRFRRYAQRIDAWGRGFVQHPIFVGLAGEYALCRWLQRQLAVPLSVDASLRRQGDGGTDVCVHGYVLQVKTIRNGNRNLVRRVDGQHRLRPLACDAYVFAKWQAGPRVVDLKGWITSRDFSEQCLLERSTVADHWNMTISDDRLLPMRRLVTAINNRRAS